jgi:phospholipid-binding lipoprotein MlaA
MSTCPAPAAPALRRRLALAVAPALLSAIALPAYARLQDADTPVQQEATATPAMSDAVADDATAPAAADVAATDEPLTVYGEPLQPASAGEPPTDDATATPVAQDASVPAEPEPLDSAQAEPAEDDFEALYGASDEDGNAAPSAYDPWERYNRVMHRFNNAVDRRVARPLAQAYVKAVPGPVRTGVGNFFSNLGQPVSAVNALLQGRPRQAAHSFGRFVLNSTLGIGGVLDPATSARLENRNEDFGQTLGVWGWKRSRYVELPLFGPRTLRDVLGMAGDAPLSPLRQIDADKVRVPLQGMQLVDMRAQLLSTDALREGAADDYALVRDAWSQRRAYQISGDREEGQLPDYLREKPTVVPVDAMPVPIPGG